MKPQKPYITIKQTLSDRQRSAFIRNNREEKIGGFDVENRRILVDIKALFDFDLAMAYELFNNYSKLPIWKWSGSDTYGDFKHPQPMYFRSFLTSKEENPIKCLCKENAISDEDCESLWKSIQDNAAMQRDIIKRIRDNPDLYKTPLHSLINEWMIENKNVNVFIMAGKYHESLADAIRKITNKSTILLESLPLTISPAEPTSGILTSGKYDLMFLSDINDMIRALDKDFGEELENCSIMVPDFPYNMMKSDEYSASGVSNMNLVKVDVNLLYAIVKGGNTLGYYERYSEEMMAEVLPNKHQSF